MTTERRLLLAAVLAWLAVAVLNIVLGPSLGHDEAAFAVAARGGGASWLYRSVGVVEVARVGVALGGAEWQLRIASAVLGTGVVLGAYAVGRAAFSSRTGAWAAAVVAGAHPMALRSSELIGDLPATACVLAGIAVLVGELGRADGPRWRLVLVGPAFALAFYLRYGSAPVIALAGVAALLVWWRSIIKRPLPAIAAAVVFALMLVPHVVQSLEVTGTLFGILEVSANMPRRAYRGEGLVTYLTWNPFRYYGALVAPVLVAGLLGLVRLPAAWRPSVFLGIVALGQVIAIGLQSHAQPRYIFVAITVLVVLGVETLARLGPPSLRRLALPLVVLAWLGVVIAVPFYTRFLTEARLPIVHAAAAVRADKGREPCVIVAKVTTQLMWYADCDAQKFKTLEVFLPWPTEGRVYAISIARVPIAIEAVLERHPAAVRELPSVPPPTRVWHVTPPRSPP